MTQPKPDGIPYPEGSLAGLSYDEIGNRISAARAYSGLSVDELAQRLEISAPTLRRWCNGDEVSLERGHYVATKVRMVIYQTACPPEFFGLRSDVDDFVTLEKSPAFRYRLNKVERRLNKLEAVSQKCSCGGDCSCK
jgi:transcriptional regulator with XRE-family HTH domain